MAPKWVRTIRHGDEELERFRGQPMLARLDYRAELIPQALEAAGYAADGFAAVAGRGGLLPPMPAARTWWMTRWWKSFAWRAAASMHRTWAPCWRCALPRRPG
jgi:hypothetical protein